jgi:nanoRNase/pAp phosphatase (c-di-AMP/oligoRNAs hydrolase)
LLRQIDRPELPTRFARVLARVMRRFEVHDGIALLHLGRVERDDLIVQMADFCLQFEGVEWVVVSGKLDGNLVIAVRNHGTGRRNAGELVRKLFGEMGSAGGHRNMSKAVIALNDWRAREHTLRDSAIETRLWELFEAQISGDNDADD